MGYPGKLALLFFALQLTFSYAKAQDNVFPIISKNDMATEMEQHVNWLCSHKLLGRSTVTGHDLLAANYIDSLFTAYSLSYASENITNGYYQDFQIVKNTPIERTITIFNRKYNYNTDFISLGINPIDGKEIEVVFGGLGEYDDIDSLDLDGKALLVITDNLRVAGMKIQEQAASKGCALIICFNPSNTKQFGLISQQLNNHHNRTTFSLAKSDPTSQTRFFSRLANPISQILISDNVAAALLGEKPSSIWQNISKGKGYRQLPNFVKIRFDFNYQTDTITTNNVIGIVPSNKNSQQSVVVGAHIDHLAPMGQFWYPGADDNASGTALLIELSRIFASLAKDGLTPKRNIVFAAFTAEEIGLLGSEHYTQNPVFPIDSISVYLNLDMVGKMDSTSEKGYVLHLSGSNRIGDFEEIIKNLIYPSNIQIDTKSFEEISLFTLSDHYHFMEKGVPAFLITSGMHSDYHKPTDTPEKLLVKGMTEIAWVTFQAIWHFANAENPWE